MPPMPESKMPMVGVVWIWGNGLMGWEDRGDCGKMVVWEACRN